MAFSVTSPAFSDGGMMPRRLSAEGDDLSPELRFADLPAGTKSLALIIDDPDAPDPKAPQRVYVHWVVYDIPPDVGFLAEGGPLPQGAKEGMNDWGRLAYGGPLPPIGTHRYFHKLYALDTRLDFSSPPTKAALLKAMDGHVLGAAQIVGLYKKK